MIVFDLKCGHGHVFEAWFGGGEEYEAQKARGLLSCPLCGDADVTKAAMAAAVPAKSNQRDAPAASLPAPVAGADKQPVATTQAMDPVHMREMLKAMANMQAKALKDSTWVGHDFARQARAMHYGEQDAALIHGQVDAGEARSLIEEGVEVAPLLVPVIPPEAKN